MEKGMSLEKIRQTWRKGEEYQVPFPTQATQIFALGRPALSNRMEIRPFGDGSFSHLDRHSTTKSGFTASQFKQNKPLNSQIAADSLQKFNLKNIAVLKSNDSGLASYVAGQIDYTLTGRM